jgi:phenylacetate-coenzyme A ligase PaaK-like adenylate-forming protein
LYGRPGEIEIITEKSLENGFYYDFPTVATGETLYPLVREKFLQVFTKVVDKMRCWDGGLSFFECREGRKHIYDELAFVEDLDGRLVSTDLFNLAHPFIRYANNDCGTYRCGDCGCGIFGNYFTEFKGKQIENLLTKSGKTLSGTHVLESIGVAVKEIPYEFNFTIRQHADKTITIHASIPLERTDRIPVMSILNRMINDVDISDLHSNIPLEWVFDREISEKKNLLVVSQAVKNVPATPWL